MEFERSSGFPGTHACWEGSDSLPQLPQVLPLAGFGNPCLFFQWIWRIPFVPFEKDEAIVREGVDARHASLFYGRGT